MLPPSCIIHQELVSDAEPSLRSLFSYPLSETIASEEARPFVEDNIKQVLDAIISAADSGELYNAIQGGHDTFKKWINSVGKSQKRKGKNLFMPMRIALTGRMQGADVGEQLEVLAKEDGQVMEGVDFVSIKERVEKLRTWSSSL